MLQSTVSFDSTLKYCLLVINKSVIKQQNKKKFKYSAATITFAITLTFACDARIKSKAPIRYESSKAKNTNISI